MNFHPIPPPPVTSDVIPSKPLLLTISARLSPSYIPIHTVVSLVHTYFTHYASLISVPSPLFAATFSLLININNSISVPVSLACGIIF